MSAIEGDDEMPVGQLVYKQKLATRLTHWVWVICLFFLLLSGLQSDPVSDRMISEIE